jgi:hypothetical protein
MAQVTTRSANPLETPPRPVEPAAARRHGGGTSTALRVLGALTLLAVGAVHLDQYFAVHFRVVPVIGPLFALNFAGATALATVLLLPLRGRAEVLHKLAALGGIGLSLTAFVFLFISEHRTVFGFMDYGYRPAIVVALVAEAATAVLLGAYLVTSPSSR